MAKRKKGQPLNGWIILDKPTGMTSTSAVGAIKRLMDAQKAGHAGTLDPLATGILPIALGEATKTVPYVVDGSKSYRFTVRWGAETDTDDCDGKVTRSSELRPTLAEIEAHLGEFTGVISQVPPQYSAIKIAGERAYDLARDGVVFEIEAREVFVERLAVTATPDDATTEFEADCGKGTYVRAIARDLGRRLGCLGHIIALRRTRVGTFGEADAITLEKIEDSSADGGAAGLLKPIEAALIDFPSFSISAPDVARLKRGQSVLMRGASAPILSGPIYAMSHGMLVAVGDVERGEFRPIRVFNL